MSRKQMIKNRSFARNVTGAALLVGLAACGAEGNNAADRFYPYDPSFGGFEDLKAGLDKLNTDCQFVLDGKTGDITITLDAAEVGLVSRRALDGAILANGEACKDADGVLATAAKVKSITVNGDATSTLILDYLGGSFSAGTSSGPGITVTGGSQFRFRGTKGADSVAAGMNADGKVVINLASTAKRLIEDVLFAEDPAEMVFSLGDGVDVFTAAGKDPAEKLPGIGLPLTSAVTVYGGMGNDKLTGGDGDDTLYGDEGDDVLVGGDGNDTIRGGAGKDTITGGLGDDELFGDDGDDLFLEGDVASGADLIMGGAGNDTVSYALRTDAVFVKNDTEGDGADPEVFTGTESGNGVDEEDEAGDPGTDGVLDGSDEKDLIGVDIETILGGAGNDMLIAGDVGVDGTGKPVKMTLNGGAGDDTLIGGNGANFFIGGAGVDTVDYSHVTGGVGVYAIINGKAESGIRGAPARDTISLDIENLVGSNNDDELIGSTGNNRFSGGTGDDIFRGIGGDNVYDMGKAPTGKKIVFGGKGLDTVDFSGWGVNLIATMDGQPFGIGHVIDSAVENLLCPTDGDDSLMCFVTGNALDNYLVGGPGPDTLVGLAGDDILDGNDGDQDNDLDCGAGNDIGLNYGAGTNTGCEL